MAGRRTKAVAEDKEIFVDRRMIANYFGVNVATINDYRELVPPMPYDSKTELYPVSRCIHWFKDLEVNKVRKLSGTPAAKAIKERKEAALAEQREYITAKLKGETVTIPDAVTEFVKILKTVRNIVKNAEGRYTTEIHGQPSQAHTQQAISKMFDSVLMEINEEIEKHNGSDHNTRSI